MAKLPDASDLGQLPVPQLPRRTPMVSEYRATTGLEDVGAKVQAKVGAELQDAAGEVLKAAEYQDNLRAEDAFSKLRQKQVDLTYGPQGFMNLKGGDAVNQPVAKTYSDQFGAEVNDIASGLSNNYQRQLFSKRAAVAGAQLNEDIWRHVGSQREQYASDVVNGTVAAESQAASANPNAIPLSVARIDSAIDQFASQYGKPPEWAAQKKTEAKSTMYTKVIEQVMDVDPGMAQQYFKTYADSLTPSDRVTVGHKVQQSVIPAQAKSIADYIIGGRNPQDLGKLQRTLDVGGETALVRVSNDMDSERQATPEKTRDTKAMLGNWVADAERVANSVRPNDPVFRDMVVQQVKNHVSTILAIQQGVQTEAQGFLLTATNGGQDGKGQKPTTLDQLLSIPGARDKYAALDPAAANGIRNLISHNAEEAARGTPVRSNSAVVNDLFQRIHLADDDPKKITSKNQLTQFFAKGINRADYDWLGKEIDEQQSLGGRSFTADQNRARTVAHTMLTRSMVGAIQPDIAEEAAYRFNADLQEKVDRYRKEGKDPRSLLTPGTQDYVLDPKRVSSFMPDARQVVSDAAAKGGVPPVSKMTKLDAKDPEKSFNALKPGEWFVAPNGKIGRKPEEGK